MGTIALLMAGGAGERMRASGVEVPKPLVRVRGVPLAERNLRQLLRHGLSDIVVAVPAGLPDVGAFVESRLVPLARAGGAVVRLLVESSPLGNIGCAGLLHGDGDPILVVYCDNLTTLDLSLLLRHHERTGAAMTLATHDEPFRLPYGRLDVVDGAVRGYVEKPTLHVSVCSAITVLGAEATAVLPQDRPTGLVDLTNLLLDSGKAVAAFRHEAPWVDVNDVEGVRRAEILVDRYGVGSPLGERSASE